MTTDCVVFAYHKESGKCEAGDTLSYKNFRFLKVTETTATVVALQTSPYDITIHCAPEQHCCWPHHDHKWDISGNTISGNKLPQLTLLHSYMCTILFAARNLFRFSAYCVHSCPFLNSKLVPVCHKNCAVLKNSETCGLTVIIRKKTEYMDYITCPFITLTKVIVHMYAFS